MMRRRELMMLGGGLPGAYRRVEWVTGSSADIDTVYVPTISPTAVAEFELRSQQDNDIMGFHNNVFPSFIVNPSVVQNKWYNRWGNTAAFDISGHSPVYNVKQAWEFGKIIKKNGEIVKTLDDVDWSTNEQSFHVFSARTAFVSMRLYRFRLYDGLYLARNMIPCYRISDNDAGLYDTVSKSFYTTTAGTITAGPEI